MTNRPVADAGADDAFPCIEGVALVSLDGTASSDPNGDSITYQWSVPPTVLLDDATNATPTGLFPLGVTTATLTVTDEHGAADTDDVIIMVIDETPPEVACTTDITSLAPANHELVDVQVSILASDLCSAPEDLVLLAVLLDSDEPDDASGKHDGATTGDTNGEDGFSSPVDVTDQFTFNTETASFEGTIVLRAEANKKGNGRTYSINVSVLDTFDNLSNSSCAVVVPKNSKKGGGGGNNGKGNGRNK
ncbi:MAG: hypothetical protein HON53_07635 [Planctomycetaceae bacterium]|nr:hypothetical protein [Planctomycetaceae bacterium]MBT6158066.1 hypothetical protein [Planctomycetaceae bacterium]MBT6486494.1 hypothetical protein [Planctomycetaceae bacterium]MBT6495817.1 hypothetical protein [Planctomycetaceae bacterium]